MPSLISRLLLKLLTLLLPFMLFGCGPSADEQALDKVVEMRKQDLEETRRELAAQTQRQEELAKLEKELRDQATVLELGPIPVEDVTAIATTLPKRLANISDGAEVKLKSLGEMEIDSSGYAIRSGQVRVSGSPKAVQGFLRQLGSPSFGRLNKVKNLKLERSDKEWSGLVFVDFYVRARARAPQSTPTPKA